MVGHEEEKVDQITKIREKGRQKQDEGAGLYI